MCALKSLGPPESAWCTQVSLGDFGTNVFPTDTELTDFISKAQPSLLWLSKLFTSRLSMPQSRQGCQHHALSTVLVGLRGEHYP